MKFLYVITIILVSSCLSSKGEDYHLVFGNDYQKAEKFLMEKKVVFEEKAAQYDIPSEILMAIVFPEIIRYNTVYDFIESTSLSLLYAGQGRKYADFSIGMFQMKPSFAEQIEVDVVHYLEKDVSDALGFSPSSPADNEENRQERILRISSFEGQLNYLIAFYLISSTRFSHVHFENIEDRVQFFSTCYNTGYQKTLNEIKAAMKNEEFHTGKLTSSRRYNYSDISVFWYRKLYT